jgi:hypothetical protein
VQTEDLYLNDNFNGQKNFDIVRTPIVAAARGGCIGDASGYSTVRKGGPPQPCAERPNDPHHSNGLRIGREVRLGVLLPCATKAM